MAKNQAAKKPLKDDVITNNDTPYEILDRYVRAAYDKTVPDNTVIVKNTNNEQKMLRDEIALLHNQLLYERHRREILGLRNRRLLGKTKNSRALEEQNTSLVRATYYTAHYILRVNFEFSKGEEGCGCVLRIFFAKLMMYTIFVLKRMIGYVLLQEKWLFYLNNWNNFGLKSTRRKSNMFVRNIPVI